MNRQEIIDAIGRLKKEKNAIVLAHYYSNPEIQDIADFLGDSLELSRKAASTEADIIVFCGVHFMAETAAILSPQKKVLIPVLGAGCSLADGVNGENLRKWKGLHPGGVVVSYVNTTAETKSETDICCTSANAVKVVESIPEDKEILFVPDQHLGNYIAKVTGRKMEVWNGNCIVHHLISTEVVLKMISEYPDADVLIHPESSCSADERILKNPACFIYSTSGIMRHARESSKKRFLIATESGALHKLKKDNPSKEFIPIDSKTICESMKKTTLVDLYNALAQEQFVVTVENSIAKKAIIPVKRMLEL